MKKINFLFALFIVALTVSACEKDEDITAQQEQIKIFMSLPSEEINDGLKSGNKTEVFNGDTILIHSRGINAFIWAENKFGEAIKGAWKAKLLKTDFSNELPDYPLHHIFWYSGPDYVSQLSFKFPEFGVYEISIGKYEDKYNRTGYQSEITFYIKVIGIPGLIGDDFQNNFIFRVEKKHLRKNLIQEKVFVIYYKYNGEYDNYYCSLNNMEQYPMLRQAGVIMKKWPYSRPGDNYYYAVIKNLSGSYVVNFYASTDKYDGVNDQNATKSSWWDDYNNGIVLTIP